MKLSQSRAYIVDDDGNVVAATTVWAEVERSHDAILALTGEVERLLEIKVYAEKAYEELRAEYAAAIERGMLATADLQAKLVNALSEKP